MVNENPIQVGGGYVESDSHVPEATDMYAQFNTSGTGGSHGKIEEVSPVFAMDKVKTAQEILGALDPENRLVDSSRVVLPSVETDNDAARKDISARADAVLKDGVVVGGPTPIEEQAALSGDEGEQTAVQEERGNAASNSVGGTGAGVHDPATPASSADSSVKSDSSTTDTSGTTPAATPSSTTSTTPASETSAPAQA